MYTVHCTVDRSDALDSKTPPCTVVDSFFTPLDQFAAFQNVAPATFNPFLIHAMPAYRSKKLSVLFHLEKLSFRQIDCLHCHVQIISPICKCTRSNYTKQVRIPSPIASIRWWSTGDRMSPNKPGLWSRSSRNGHHFCVQHWRQFSFLRISTAQRIVSQWGHFGLIRHSFDH